MSCCACALLVFVVRVQMLVRSFALGVARANTR